MDGIRSILLFLPVLSWRPPTGYDFSDSPGGGRHPPPQIALKREPIQLELFVPHAQGYEFKAVITNKEGSANRILLFHNGRATQESLFSELKGQCQMDYVPTRRLVGNQLYFLSTVLAHNLYRELEMRRGGVHRFTTAKRAALGSSRRRRRCASG